MELNKFTGLLITKTNEGAPGRLSLSSYLQATNMQMGWLEVEIIPRGGTQELLGLSVSSQQGLGTR